MKFKPQKAAKLIDVFSDRLNDSMAKIVAKAYCKLPEESRAKRAADRVLFPNDYEKAGGRSLAISKVGLLGTALAGGTLDEFSISAAIAVAAAFTFSYFSLKHPQVNIEDIKKDLGPKILVELNFEGYFFKKFDAIDDTKQMALEKIGLLSFPLKSLFNEESTIDSYREIKNKEFAESKIAEVKARNRKLFGSFADKKELLEKHSGILSSIVETFTDPLETDLQFISNNLELIINDSEEYGKRLKSKSSEFNKLIDGIDEFIKDFSLHLQQEEPRATGTVYTEETLKQLLYVRFELEGFQEYRAIRHKELEIEINKFYCIYDATKNSSPEEILEMLEDVQETQEEYDLEKNPEIEKFLKIEKGYAARIQKSSHPKLKENLLRVEKAFANPARNRNEAEGITYLGISAVMFKTYLSSFLSSPNIADGAMGMWAGALGVGSAMALLGDSKTQATGYKMVGSVGFIATMTSALADVAMADFAAALAKTSYGTPAYLHNYYRAKEVGEGSTQDDFFSIARKSLDKYDNKLSSIDRPKSEWTR